MKRIFKLFFIILVAFSLSSCAIHSGLTNNTNNNVTNVVLQSNNYKIVGKVKGTASGLWVLCFGGSFSPLVDNARSEMLKNADLIGHSRAIIDETVEVNNKFYIILGYKTVTVSAYVVEFTDTNNMPQRPTRRENIRSQEIEQPQQLQRPEQPQRPERPERPEQLQRPEQPQQQTNVDSYNTQPQTQLKDLQSQSSIQVSGWYYTYSPDGNNAIVPVNLTVQKRDTGNEYSILSVNGEKQKQATVAFYNKDKGLYDFNWGNTLISFSMK